MDIDFIQPSSDNLFPRLAAGEVHLWRARLDEFIVRAASLESSLSEGELARAASLRFPAGRSQFIVGRALLRMLLGGYLNTDPAKILLKPGSHGKPEVAPRHVSHLTFNLSHSEGLAIYAFASGARVGVDIEAVHPVREAEYILQHYFSREERKEFMHTPSAEQPHFFLGLWTKREAYLKGLGDGLSRAEELDLAAIPTLGWEIIPFQPWPGTIAALACEGKPASLSAWEIPAGWASRPPLPGRA